MEAVRIDDDTVFVGALFVPQGTRQTRHYEVAAWYQIEEAVEDRWLPVFAHRHHPYYKSPRTEWILYAEVPAVVTEAFFPALFAGRMIDSGEPQGKHHRTVGTETSFNRSVEFLDGCAQRFIPVDRFPFDWVKTLHMSDYDGRVFDSEGKWQPSLGACGQPWT